MRSGITAWLRRLLYAGSGSLRPYEKAVMDAWAETLPPEGRSLLAAQLDHCDLVQRLSADKLVTFHAPGSETTWPEAYLFPLRSLDSTVARVEIQSGAPAVRVDVVLHRGRLHSLEFGKPPRSISGEFKVRSVKTILDPMTPAPAAKESRVAPVEPLPREYVELVGDSPVVHVDGWDVLGRQALHRIVHPEANYLVLAEGEGGFIALRESDGALVFLDDNSDFESPAPVSFREALRARRDGGDRI